MPWLEAAEAGNRLWEEGDEEGALREWEKAVELGFSDEIAFFYLGRHYALREDWEKAILYLRQARPHLEHSGEEEEMILAAHELLALAYQNTGDFFESYLHYRRALRLAPDSPSLHLGLAHLNLRRGRVDEAVRAASRVLEISPADGRANLIMGMAAERRRDYRAAAEHYRLALEADPGDWSARLARGLILAVHLGREGEAERELERVLRERPDLDEAHAALGEIYLRRGEAGPAEEAALRAREINPDNYSALTLLGRLRLQEEDFERAEVLFREALDVEPQGAAALYGVGVVLFQRGEYLEAESLFRRALALVPRFPEAALNRGMVLDALGRREEALKALGELVADHPEFAPGQLGLGRVHYYSGRPERALPFFRNALALDPAAWEPYYFIGNTLRDLGSREEALEYYLAARKRGGESPSLLTDLARAYEEGGDLVRAESVLEEALAADPRYLPALLRMSLLKARLDRGEEAARLYRQALVLRPGDASWGFVGEERDFLQRIVTRVDDYLGGGLDYLSLFALIRNLSREEKVFPELIPVLRERVLAHPFQPQYSHLLGLAYGETGDLENAERYFRRALRIDSDFTAAHLSLGQLYSRTGRNEQARRHLSAVLLLAPGSSFSPEVRALLEDIPE